MKCFRYTVHGWHKTNVAGRVQHDVSSNSLVNSSPRQDEHLSLFICCLGLVFSKRPAQKLQMPPKKSYVQVKPRKICVRSDCTFKLRQQLLPPTSARTRRYFSLLQKYAKGMKLINWRLNFTNIGLDPLGCERNYRHPFIWVKLFSKL